ncbi:hypothetical protein MHYP_G00185220 [Metynnis hypsauchen]
MRVMHAACPEMKQRSDEFMRRFCFALKRFPPDIKGRGIVNLLRLAIRVAGGNHVQSAAQRAVRPSEEKARAPSWTAQNYFNTVNLTGQTRRNTSPQVPRVREKGSESRGGKFSLLSELVNCHSTQPSGRKPSGLVPTHLPTRPPRLGSASLRALVPRPSSSTRRKPRSYRRGAGMKARCSSSGFSFFQVEAAPLRSPSSETAPSSGMAPTTDAQEKYTYRLST